MDCPDETKFGVVALSESTRNELAPHNIRVNSLGPTFLETPMTRPFFENKAFRDEVLSKIKLGRLGQLEELTGAIVFLASDASSLMTGSALVLDGGDCEVGIESAIVTNEPPALR